MAYQFVAASTQRLTANAPVTTLPVTVFCRFSRSNGGDTANVALSIPSGSLTDTLILSYTNQGTNTWQTFAGDGFRTAFTTLTITANVWNTIVSTVATQFSRSVWANGSANTGSNVTGVLATTPTTIGIGAWMRSNIAALPFDGSIADVAVWSASLGTAEIDSLHKGFKPTRIQPQNLKFYSPLIRDLQDFRGGLTITNTNGATVSVHPRVY